MHKHSIVLFPFRCPHIHVVHTAWFSLWHFLVNLFFISLPFKLLIGQPLLQCTRFPTLWAVGRLTICNLCRKFTCRNS